MEESSPRQAIITWLDTAHYPGWYGSRDEIPKRPIGMESVGWMICQDDDVVVLAMTYSEFKMGDLLVIPKRCVKSIEILETAKYQGVSFP